MKFFGKDQPLSVQHRLSQEHEERVQAMLTMIRESQTVKEEKKVETDQFKARFIVGDMVSGGGGRMLEVVAVGWSDDVPSYVLRSDTNTIIVRNIRPIDRSYTRVQT